MRHADTRSTPHDSPVKFPDFSYYYLTPTKFFLMDGVSLINNPELHGQLKRLLSILFITNKWSELLPVSTLLSTSSSASTLAHFPLCSI